MQKAMMMLIVVILGAALVLGGCASKAPSPAPSPAPSAKPAPAPTKAAPAPSPKPAPAPTPKATAPAPTAKPSPGAVSAADFYKNNPLTMVVPYGAGGGTDILGRVFASFWPEVTGGNARVLNVPGAGAQAGINQSYTAKPDGLTMTLVALGAGLTLPVLTKDAAVKYDATKFTWIGGPLGNFPVFAISKTLPYNSIGELQKAEGLKFAAETPLSANSFASALVIDILGLKGASIVTGFPGSAGAALSVGKGETQALVFGPGGITTFVQKGFVKPPLAIVALEKTAWFPDVKPISELAKLTPEQTTYLKTLTLIEPGFGYFFASPGVPQDRVDFVRDAFLKVVKLPGYKQLYALNWPIWEEPISGKDFAVKVNAALALKQADIDALLKLVQKYKAL